jgi:hypothetical protein
MTAQSGQFLVIAATVSHTKSIKKYRCGAMSCCALRGRFRHRRAPGGTNLFIVGHSQLDCPAANELVAYAASNLVAAVHDRQINRR